MIRKLHEDHGIQFHLPGKVRSLSDHQVVLESNETLDADLVVVGIGVRPSLGLAEQAGIALDRGITVDKYLRTSVLRILAAGDVARWPDPHTGQKVRALGSPNARARPRRELNDAPVELTRAREAVPGATAPLW